MPVSAGSWVTIHDLSSDMRILYVSSNLRSILDYNPCDCVGQPLTAFLLGESISKYPESLQSDTTDNVVIGYTRAKGADGNPVVIRSISFVCSNMNFVIGSFDPRNHHYEQMMENTRIRHFRYAAIDAKKHETLSKIEQAVRSMPASAHDAPPTQPNESPSLHRSHPTLPGMIQACMILDSLKTLPRESPHGPRIRFATNSMEHILNCDAVDLLGVPLLSTVAQCDVTKASEFLQKLGTGTGIYFITLHLRRDPFAPLVEGQATELVVVDIMGAGSDDGGILLCQPQKSQPQRRRQDSHYETMCESDSAVPILTDMISTDAETSGYDSSWQGLGIEQN